MNKIPVYLWLQIEEMLDIYLTIMLKFIILGICSWVEQKNRSKKKQHTER